MIKISRYLASSGIAGAVLLAASTGFAAPIDNEIARIDALLATAPAQRTAIANTPTVKAQALRDAAVDAWRGGDAQTAQIDAQLALHELGEDGIQVNSDEMAYTCIGGCPGRDLPSVSA